MTIEDMTDTDLEQALDQTIVKAFESADYISEIESEEEPIQCTQRVTYDSSYDERPGLTLEDLVYQQAQYCPTAADMMEAEELARESPPICRLKSDGDEDTQDGVWIANKINKTIVINSPSPDSPKRKRVKTIKTYFKKGDKK